MKDKKIQPGESVDRWIKRAPPALVPILERLRSMILDLPVELEERIKWSHPAYGVGKINIFSLGWHQHHAGLQLWVGAHLPDPAGIIEGTGKNLRHIKFPVDTAPNWNTVQEIMLASLSFLALDSR